MPRPATGIALVLLVLAGCGGSTVATPTQAAAWTTAQRESVEATCKGMAKRTANRVGICDCIVPQAEREGHNPDQINRMLARARLPRIPSARAASCEREKSEHEAGK
jgi:hypothetical protein